MSGPPPTPTSIRSRRGNPGKRALNRREPKPQPYTGGCPDWLDATAAAWWRDFAPRLERAGTLDELSVEHLTLAAVAYSTIRAATKTLDEEGLTAVCGKNEIIMPHPAVGIRKTAMADFRAHTAELGFGPGTRSRIVVAPPAAPSKWLGLVKA